MIGFSVIPALLLLTVDASAMPACPPNAQLAEAMAGLRRNNTRQQERLDLFARQPAVAVCHLVRSLRVVRETHVVGYEQAKYPDTMQVIWALRALRYLTDCQDFRAATAEDPAAWEHFRRGFLLPAHTGTSTDGTRARPVVKFFQTWMSRDSVFIAPADAQQAIIMQWRDWYRATAGHGVRYRACPSIDDWYF